MELKKKIVKAAKVIAGFGIAYFDLCAIIILLG